MHACLVHVQLHALHMCSWIDPLFWHGFKQEVTQKDLYAVPEEAKSQDLLKKFDR